MSRFDQLEDWLSWLEGLHSQAIDLGLERVFQVAMRMHLLSSQPNVSLNDSGALSYLPAHVVTVAGTNGKGSCIATLESLLLAEGKGVGCYTSPHLHHYCERIRLNGKVVSEDDVCRAFSTVDEARANISLTYFEFGTLAALWLFSQARVPYVLLEVGLGGRLDAVNVVDATVSVITSIDIDHQEWLGSDRDGIAREKLGIARPGCPLIIAEPDHTPNLSHAIQTYPSIVYGQDYSIESISDHSTWLFQFNGHTLSLPKPSLPLPSVAAALVVADNIGITLCESALKKVMTTLSLPGRFQPFLLGGRQIIYDVAHNPAAAGYLANNLIQRPIEGSTYGVLAVMADKDIEKVVEPLLPLIDRWYVGELNGIVRAAPASELVALLAACDQPTIHQPTIEQAFFTAFGESSCRDRIVVFGSFYTVSAIQQFVSQYGAKLGRET